jgi:hypothetical protein
LAVAGKADHVEKAATRAEINYDPIEVKISPRGKC